MWSYFLRDPHSCSPTQPKVDRLTERIHFLKNDLKEECVRSTKLQVCGWVCCVGVHVFECAHT